MPSLADAILQEDINSISQLLRYGVDINQLDEYGYRPIIEAAIMDNTAICKLLLAAGADPGLADVTGGTALHWAAENNNLQLAELLLRAKANPNIYNLAGQVPLVMPILRDQAEMKQLLLKAGADQLFAQDYINVKMLGHLYELVGSVNLLAPDRQFVEVDFEGFYLEITVNLIASALTQFQNHYAARQLRRFSGIAKFIVDVLERGAKLIKFQQYRVDLAKHTATIDQLIKTDPLLIPIGYEGHAIAFVRYGDLWVKCDRRETSRLYDNVMIYRMTKKEALTPALIKTMLYQKLSDEFVNEELDKILGLQPITELKVEAQISGNCTWANIEATIPAIFFLVLMQLNQEQQAISYYKSLALNYFHRWRDWNKDRALNYCIQSYNESTLIRKASKAEILAAILFQRVESDQPGDRARIEKILELLIKSPYEYILHNYLKIYFYENYTKEGKRFAELLRQNGVIR